MPAYPLGPRELHELCSSTGMVQLINLSQLTPLILGAKRICTHCRAKAIMSVIGATNWFQTNDFAQFRSPESADDMVFGLYPPAFIDEVRKCVGASFFLCENEATTLKTSSNRGDRVRQMNVLQETMLPFSRDSAGRFSATAQKRKGFVDHPTVAESTLGAGGGLFARRGRGPVCPARDCLHP